MVVLLCFILFNFAKIKHKFIFMLPSCAYAQSYMLRKSEAVQNQKFLAQILILFFGLSEFPQSGIERINIVCLVVMNKQAELP